MLLAISSRLVRSSHKLWSACQEKKKEIKTKIKKRARSTKNPPHINRSCLDLTALASLFFAEGLLLSLSLSCFFFAIFF